MHDLTIERGAALLDQGVGALAEQRRQVTGVIVDDAAGDHGPVEAAALERRRHFDARMTDVVAQAQRAGLVRDDLDPSVVARLAFGAMNSTVEWYRPDGRVSPTELADAVSTLVFRGIGTSAYMASS